MSSIYAWAFGTDAAQTERDAAQFPGLGLVLHRLNFEAVSLGRPSLAYVNTPTQVEQALTLSAQWQGFILKDEVNTKIPHEKYAKQFAGMSALIPAEMRIWTAPMRPVGSWLQEHLCLNMRYDADYPLPYSNYNGWNPNKTRWGHIVRTIEADHSRWLISPAPFTRGLMRYRQPVGMRRWLALAEHPRVFAVAFWSLRQFEDQPHGLIHANGSLSHAGRAVKAALDG